MDFALVYSKTGGDVGNANLLTAFVDADWAGDPDSRRSTTGYVLLINGAAIAWKSKRQSVIALSSAEAEFVAASTLVQEITYCRKLLEALGFPQPFATSVAEDNATAISWSEGSVGGSDRAKHIDLREHYVHDAVAQGVLKLIKVSTEDNLADLLTKPLPKERFLVLRKRLKIGRAHV